MAINYTLQILFPIERPELPLPHLRLEAINGLWEEIERREVIAIGTPSFNIHHKERKFEVACKVRDLKKEERKASA